MIFNLDPKNLVTFKVLNGQVMNMNHDRDIVDGLHPSGRPFDNIHT